MSILLGVKGCVHSTYGARGRGGQVIVINFINVQGGGGVKKGQKLAYVHGP